jgi:16S rRNA (cytosine967-C5)-methyltransferase
MRHPSTSGRDIALDVLKRVATQGAFASSALRAAFTSDVPAVERGLATELVYGVLRMRGHLDRALRRASGKRLKDLDPAIHDVLRLGAYQIAMLDRIPAFAAVDCAVEQAKKRKGPKAGNQVNAILRKLSSTVPEDRIPPSIEVSVDPIRHVAECGSVSLAVAEALVQDLGAEEASRFAIASLAKAELTLRANLVRTTAEALASEVGGAIGTLPYAVRTSGSLPSELPAVIEGRASPQDEASMRVVELLDPQAGERILDVCAAPGGKTTHAAERMQDRGAVVAHDRLPDRLERVRENAARLGLACVEVADVLPPLEERFDRVLVDAPCSGLGTLRRHPEIRWRFAPSDVTTLAKVQAEVLREGAARVRPGGILVYSVCTVTRAEGEAQIRALDGFALEATLRTGPQDPGAPDGFFAARLKRT